MPVSVKKGARAKAAAKARKKGAKVKVHKTKAEAKAYAKKTGAKLMGVAGKRKKAVRKRGKA